MNSQHGCTAGTNHLAAVAVEPEAGPQRAFHRASFGARSQDADSSAGRGRSSLPRGYGTPTRYVLVPERPPVTPTLGTSFCARGSPTSAVLAIVTVPSNGTHVAGRGMVGDASS
jgi:hypothetical protein